MAAVAARLRAGVCGRGRVGHLWWMATRAGANEAPVRVRGGVRLVLELVVLLGGAVAVTWAGETAFGVVLGLLVVCHYATTMPRVTWLVSQ